MHKINWSLILNNPEKVKWKFFFRALVLGISAYCSFSLALFITQLPDEIYRGSLIALALGFVLIFFGFRNLWLWIKTISLKKLALGLLGIYILAVLILAITTAAQNGFFRAVLTASKDVPIYVFNRTGRFGQSIINYPRRFSGSYIRKPGAVGVGSLANEPVIVNLSSVSSQSKSSLKTGSIIQFSKTAGSTCALIGTSRVDLYNSDAVIREGPRYFETEIKWRVQNEFGSAWCPVHVLIQ
jgi:hypothetical protein